MNQPAQPNVTAAMTGAAILSGEKSYQSVQFAITGDGETDLIAGILAVINSAPGRITRFSPSTITRVLLYLAGRFAEDQKALDRQEEAAKDWQRLSRGMPAPVTAPAPPFDYTTSGGTAGYAIPGKPLVEVFQDEEKLARDAVKVEMIRGMLNAHPDIHPEGWQENDEPGKKI